MTTLPQTTTPRLPRPSGQISPNGAPSPNGMMPTGGPPQGPQMTPADVWRVIRSNIWLILIMLVAAVAAGYGANRFLAKYYPSYTSEGIVQVRANPNLDPLNRDPRRADRNDIQIEQRTQAQLLRSEHLINQLLMRDRVRETGWFGQYQTRDAEGAVVLDTEEAKRALRREFRVTPVPDTTLILVSMSARHPLDAKVIVEEAVNVHLQGQRSATDRRQERRNQALQDLRGRYERQINTFIAPRLNELASQLSMQGGGVPGRLNALEVEMQEWTRTQMRIEMEHDQAVASYESIQRQLAQGIDPPSIEEAVYRHPIIQHYIQLVDAIEIEIAQLVPRLGPNHNQVKALVLRREETQRKLDDRRSQEQVRQRVALMEFMDQQVAITGQQVERVNQRIEELRQNLADLSNRMADWLTLKDEEVAMRELLKQVDEQLIAAGAQRAQTNDLAPVDWMQQPIIPDVMAFPRLPITMAVAILLGLALALGIAFLRELMDSSVRSPRDIARVGQMNLLGMVPDEAEDPQAERGRLPLVIFEAPHSMLAEQFRQVRTRLQHAAPLESARSLLVTSPGPGDGKTTVACNLAAGLALNGRRILLVDGNFRRPQIHKVFSADNQRGLGDVLNAPELFDEAVQETTIPNLSIMTTGPRPSNPTELLESQLLTDFIERALEEYDHVIFDSGPLLFVSETVALAPRVDGVVTVVRARSNSRGLLQRMRDSLRQLKTEHLGVVLNAVRAQAGGYYNRNIKAYYAYQGDQN